MKTKTILKMKTSLEEFIQGKLLSIERQLGEMRQLLADMNSDTLTTASLQGKLNEANKKIRNLEYENFFLKNHKKPAKTKK